MSNIYPGGDAQYSTNLGLSLWGADEVVVENFLLIDAAIGSGSSVHINGTVIPNVNFVNSATVTFSVIGSNVSATSAGGGGTGTVTSFSSGNLSPLFTTSVATPTTTPALSFALSTQIANTVFAGPVSGVAAAPTFRALVVADFPTVNGNVGSFTYASITVNAQGLITAAASGAAPTGTVTSFSAGNIGTIITSSVATPTTTPALTFAITTQNANTVWAGPTTGAAATPTFRALVAADLPAGTGTVTSFSAGALSPLFTTSVATATTTPALTFALSNAAQNSVFAGPATGGTGAPTFRALVAADIPSGTVLWNQIGNAAANLTLANAAFTTTFNQTSAVPWLWANTTAATNVTTNASPLLEFAANYNSGTAGTPVSSQDLWTLGSSLAAGPNGASTLTFGHSGSTGAQNINFAQGHGNLTWNGVNTVGLTSNTGILVFNDGNAAVTITAGSVAFANQSLFLASAALVKWNADSGISRLGAASLAIGNGTAGDFSGALKLTTLTVVGNSATFGLAGTTSGVLTLSGSTSGSATITAPAVAGTITNAVTFSNAISTPRINVASADFAGTATITAAATTVTVNYAANYTGAAAPVVVITPTSDPLAAGVPVGYWVVATGSTTAWTGFTINIQTALLANIIFNYIVIGKA